MRWIVSSLTLWYWSESWCPALTWRTLPTYRSVWAQISSYPQGFSTRRGTFIGRSLPEALLAREPFCAVGIVRPGTRLQGAGSANADFSEQTWQRPPHR